MNNLLITCLILLCFTFQAFGQEELKTINEKLAAMQTTQKEYDYMMEGYKEQKDYALNMKPGYTLGNFYSAKINGFTFTARDLIRKETDQYVGTIIHIKAGNGAEEYVAIPYMNEDLMDIHRAHLKYILRKKQLSEAYSKFHSKRIAVASASAY